MQRSRSLSLNNSDTSDFHHVEFSLTRAAGRTAPVFWNIGPACSWSDPFAGRPVLFVIDVAASATLPAFVNLAHLILGKEFRCLGH